MGFFIAMFLCNLLMPSIMVMAGYCMYKNPPKEINGLIGYRTAMSEIIRIPGRLRDYCRKLWIKSFIILLVPTVLVQIPFSLKSGEDVVGTNRLSSKRFRFWLEIGLLFLHGKALRRKWQRRR